MKKLTQLIIFLIIAACGVVLFSGCSLRNPPSVEKIEAILQNNYDDFMLINSFLSASVYRNIKIDDCSGIMQADSEEVPIDDVVNTALKSLMTKKILKKVRKSGQTIHYLLWTRFTDAGCGLAFSIAAGVEPRITYLTELVPLQNAGWYYYVADYNEWRAQQL